MANAMFVEPKRRDWLRLHTGLLWFNRTPYLASPDQTSDVASHQNRSPGKKKKIRENEQKNTKQLIP